MITIQVLITDSNDSMYRQKDFVTVTRAFYDAYMLQSRGENPAVRMAVALEKLVEDAALQAPREF